jgi:hypothetical protein
MDKALLVNLDIAIGSEVLKALDNAGLDPRVVLWLYTPEYEEWRLAIGSPILDAKKPGDAYGAVNAAMDAAGISIGRAPSTLILRMTDPFIRSLRRLFAKTKSVELMRLGNQMIGDRFVEDAVVYRIA